MEVSAPVAYPTPEGGALPDVVISKSVQSVQSINPVRSNHSIGRIDDQSNVENEESNHSMTHSTVQTHSIASQSQINTVTSQTNTVCSQTSFKISETSQRLLDNELKYDDSENWRNY